MKTVKRFMPVLCFLQALLAGILTGQGNPYAGPDDPAGDPASVRSGVMSGNRIMIQFKNTTELSGWPPQHFWPSASTGNAQSDGIALLVGARVFVKGDSVPVTDPMQIADLSVQGLIDTLFYCQTSYREETDWNTEKTVQWGLNPVSGYFNPAGATPAMSNDAGSWPPAGWPSTGHETKWPGVWNGRFGRGVLYADLESYFVANDAQDQEYLGPDDAVKYFPRPGIRRMGDVSPDLSIQRDCPWGGIGIRVEQRGMQWNNPLARDVIFWEYRIANISDYDLPEIAFGFWIDTDVGGTDQNGMGALNESEDLAYTWNRSGKGAGGQQTGTLGFVLLETPSNSWDGIDNDEDGLVDERRDNAVTALVGPTAGIADMQKFLAYYHKKGEDLKTHWDADEDQDWIDGIDPNSDGRYEAADFAGDDVGLDGLGPGELPYPGPDYGECNHRPDFEPGEGCEPDFAALDNHESDMLGLTSFQMFNAPNHVSPYQNWFRNDFSMWELIGRNSRNQNPNISNLIITFSAGPFPLYRGREECISVAELHADDPLDGLNSTDHSAPLLFELKRVIQGIYENDYRMGTTGILQDVSKPLRYGLEQNYPNPFNTSTKIAYSLPCRGRVQISIYNVMGQKVNTAIDEYQQSGHHEILFNAGGLASGIYYYEIRSGSYHLIRKMAFLK